MGKPHRGGWPDFRPCFFLQCRAISGRSLLDKSWSQQLSSLLHPVICLNLAECLLGKWEDGKIGVRGAAAGRFCGAPFVIEWRIRFIVVA